MLMMLRCIVVSVVEARMQSDLDDVTQYLCSSRLRLNVVKSASMLIGSCQRIASKAINVFFKLFIYLFRLYSTSAEGL